MIDIIQNSKKYTLVPVLLSLVLLLPVFCPNAHAAIRDLVRFGSDLLIEEDMSVRDAVVIAGDVTVDGVATSNVDNILFMISPPEDFILISIWNENMKFPCQA